uniref:Uncharacterized protein n=1 Tax=Physcomitrium patens TaxID=3218 RepID=A0A2K1JLJ6_PHYPA|nr:hypothetical protein PHYPA_017254 [Physcomitrium patens]
MYAIINAFCRNLPTRGLSHVLESATRCCFCLPFSAARSRLQSNPQRSHLDTDTTTTQYQHARNKPTTIRTWCANQADFRAALPPASRRTTHSK